MSRFIAGLSRGLANDYTTLAVVETFGEYQINKRYNLRHLERFKGISSDKLAKLVQELINKKPLNENTSTVIDAHGFGQTLVDRLSKAKLYYITVTVTEDNEAISEESNYRVSKKELIANLQFLFVAERLRIKQDLPLSNIIIKEILNYRLKNSSLDHENQKVCKEETHDDLVFALALACWYGQEVSRKEVKLR
ncbi:MAG: hypothetical protein HYW01_06695 [Deltaproteobacteria bacterium]|nr:hypothetical protein [Deltaproteobacteria bacterium]